jgi:hypothetical protein
MYEWELLKKYNVIMKYEEDEVLSMCYKSVSYTHLTLPTILRV